MAASGDIAVWNGVGNGEDNCGGRRRFPPFLDEMCSR
jgi:hypothetical protein